MFIRATFISVLVSAIISWASPTPDTSPAIRPATLAARDISCTGDVDWCSGTNYVVGALNWLLQENLNDNSGYGDGSLLACCGAEFAGWCAFMDGSSANGATVKQLSRELANGGCGTCGSVLDGNGYFRVDWTSNSCAQGLSSGCHIC